MLDGNPPVELSPGMMNGPRIVEVSEVGSGAAVDGAVGKMVVSGNPAVEPIGEPSLGSTIGVSTAPLELDADGVLFSGLFWEVGRTIDPEGIPPVDPTSMDEVGRTSCVEVG
jgi:hypothetical protein